MKVLVKDDTQFYQLVFFCVEAMKWETHIQVCSNDNHDRKIPCATFARLPTSLSYLVYSILMEFSLGFLVLWGSYKSNVVNLFKASCAYMTHTVGS